MKLMLFSDLHCDRAAAAELVRLAREVDVVIGAGDFGNCRRGLDAAIGSLSAIERPSVVVAGNAESIDELRAACRNWPAAQALHGDSVAVNGVTFFGLGGAVPETPFGDWSWDHSEAAARQWLAAAPAGCVLVSHSPPQGILDQDSQGRSLGSVAVREVIDRRPPRLVVCGHIHASAGRWEQAGATAVVNAGPRGIVWDLETARPVNSPQS